jgi:hypothetical protein
MEVEITEISSAEVGVMEVDIAQGHFILKEG